MNSAKVLALLSAAVGVACAGQQPPAAYVDTRIGSGGVGFGIGGINPGAQVPYGALRLGPDTSLGLGASRSTALMDCWRCLGARAHVGAAVGPFFMCACVWCAD